MMKGRNWHELRIYSTYLQYTDILYILICLYIYGHFIVEPNIKKDNRHTEIKFQKGIELKCELSTKANPRAEITWYRCDCDNCSRCEELELFENTTTVVNSEILSSLAIQNQTFETVIYGCKAKNIVGSDERKWTVIKGRLNYSSIYFSLDWTSIASKFAEARNVTGCNIGNRCTF